MLGADLHLTGRTNSLSVMNTRAQQRAETRERIVDAAVAAFAELGFRGASTREIAKRADSNQGLITYHFRTKDDLWRAAADRLFGMLSTTVVEQAGSGKDAGTPEGRRKLIRAYVRFAAVKPELFRFMVDEGKNSDERMEWLVDKHLKPLMAAMRKADGAGTNTAFENETLPHFYYIMAGAASLIFAVAPECRRLTGLDPETDEAIEKHAELVARLLVP